jgi:hypothetical protein
MHHVGHLHSFESAVYVLAGIAYRQRAGDVLFAGRHSCRWTGPWQRLESQTSGNTGRPWLRT